MPGRFGWPEKREFPATIGLNEKGGMNDAEFKKYVENNLLHLIPNVIDETGKRVCLKVDNGPGRNGRSLLLKMRFKGWYMYPGLPNATSVQQETDINYGPFKTAVRLNLKRIADACFAQRISLSLRQSTFRLIVYGGVCPDSGAVCENEMQSAFSISVNLNSWSKVGAVPFSQKCLTNPKVWHNGTDSNDPLFDAYTDIQQQNNCSTTQLNVMGYNGDVLKAQYFLDKFGRDRTGWHRSQSKATEIGMRLC